VTQYFADEIVTQKLEPIIETEDCKLHKINKNPNQKIKKPRTL